ncbi:MAG: flagellar M-ring protein FliF [Acidobacteria bacterium]|nr:flagellar M-ring protein FliF [Acidobacteriota bacterium]
MASQATQLEKRGSAGEEKQSLLSVGHVLSRLQSRWAAMPGKQRKRTMAAFLSLAGLSALLTWWGFRTDWRTLYSGLDTEDARQVGLILTQSQIAYELSDDGLAVRVPSSQLDKARLATSGKALKSGRMGFELFDKPNWMGSEFDEQVNYQRALEGELEHTVSTLSDVENARVHLVMPHESLFRDQQRPAKASVVLKLRRASLGDGEADSIRNLVASAVDGLSPQNVVLVDASGRLSLGPKTAAAALLNMEHGLEEKIVSTLEAVAGPGNVRASVTIDYGSDTQEETSESYDPSQTATLSMERSEQTSGGVPLAAGVPGTASNVPNSQTAPVFPRQVSAAQSSKSESGTYGVSKTIRHRVEGPGKIRRLTVAVLVNDRMIAGDSKGHSAQWQARSADEMRNLTALTQAAVGFDGARGDSVNVQNMSFDDNRVRPQLPIPVRVFSVLRSSPEILRYFSISIAAIVFYFFGVRPALRQVQLLAKEIPRESQVENGSADKLLQSPVDARHPDPDRLRSQEIFEKVRSQIKNEPSQSTRLLQSWIRSE